MTYFTSVILPLNRVGPWSDHEPGVIVLFGAEIPCAAVRRDGAGEAQGGIIYEKGGLNPESHRWGAWWMGSGGAVEYAGGLAREEAVAMVDRKLGPSSPIP